MSDNRISDKSHNEYGIGLKDQKEYTQNLVEKMKSAPNKPDDGDDN